MSLKGLGYGADGVFLQVQGPLAERQAGTKMEADCKCMKFLTSKIELVDGSAVIGTAIQPNQTVLIRPGLNMKPRDHRVLIGFNPELLKYGAVSHAVFVTQDDFKAHGDAGIFIRFDCKRKVDLADLTYVIRLVSLE